MIIKKITICNLFAYEDKNEIIFARPKDGKNINMLLADNNSGKSGLFRSLKILFAGILFNNESDLAELKKEFLDVKGNAIPNNLNFLKGNDKWAGILNSAADPKNANFYIEIELENTKTSVKTIIKRSFKYTINDDEITNNIIETLEITVDDAYYKDVKDINARVYPREALDPLPILKEIVNPQLLNFFFFDGEQLGGLSQKLDGELTARIKELLNIKPLENIINNIKSTTSTLKQGSSESNLELGLKQRGMENDKEHAENKTEQLKEKLKLENEKLENLNEELKKIDAIYSDEHDSTNKRHEELAKKKTQIETKYNDSLERFKEGGFRFLLQSVAMPFLQSLYEDNQNSGKSKELINELIEQARLLQNETLVACTESDKAELEAIFTKHIDELQHHDEIPIDIKKIKEILIQPLVKGAKKELKDLEVLLNEKNAITGEFNLQEERNLQENAGLNALRKEKDKLFKAVGAQEEKINHTKNEINELENKIEEYNKSIIAIEQQYKIGKKEEQKIKLARIYKKIVEKYMEDKMTKCSSDLISYIDLNLSYFKEKYTANPEKNFKITINTGRGAVKISSISAGIRQIVAACVLCGLMRVAVKDFPLIIDTPLGRISNNNRQTFIEEVYPNMSKQIIILIQSGELGGERLRSVIKDRLSDLHFIKPGGVEKFEKLALDDIYRADEIEERGTAYGN